MKKILFLITFLATSFSYSQVKDWEFILESENGTYYYKPNNNRTAWVKVVSEKTKYYPKETYPKAKIIDGYVMALWKFDCEEQKMGIVKSTTYSKDGKSLDSFSDDEILVDMDYVNPDSVGEAILNTFCRPKE
jgi:hypothetical protein